MTTYFVFKYIQDQNLGNEELGLFLIGAIIPWLLIIGILFLTSKRKKYKRKKK